MPNRPAQDVNDQVRRQFASVAANYRTSAVHASLVRDLDRMIASVGARRGRARS